MILRTTRRLCFHNSGACTKGDKQINERFGSYDLNEAARYIYSPTTSLREGAARWMLGGELAVHGVEVRRRAAGGPGDPRASEVLIRRICVRYEDGGRVCFVPEAGEEFFSRDDVHRVVGMLHTGSEAME
jgi:hypothetical protein